jgi:magnesium chelatase family protein
MLARINTIAFQGVDVQSIDVQVQISNGLPAFTIVEYIK